MSIVAAAWFIAGLGLLVVGAEFVVRGASRLALSLGVRPLVLGLTVVAVGTSAPELAVGITASFQGSGALAVGNIAGTNSFNILFIMGLSALLKPLPLQLQILKLELPVTILAAGLMTALAWDGTLTRADGCLMLGTAVLYTIALVRFSRRESRVVKAEFAEVCSDDVEAAAKGSNLAVRLRSSVLLVCGLACSVLGANWLVDGAVSMARGLGISEAVIGLTIVAVGTSAPEFVTTVIATLRNERDVAVGNLIGSSIYNILVILGLTCAVSPAGVPVERQLLLVDIPLMAGVMLACVPVFVTGKRVSRLEGGLFVAIYLAYMGWLLAGRS